MAVTCLELNLSGSKLVSHRSHKAYPANHRTSKKMLSRKHAIEIWRKRVASEGPDNGVESPSLPLAESNPEPLHALHTSTAHARKRRRVRPKGSIIRCDVLLPGSFEDFLLWQVKQSGRLSPYPGFISSAQEYHLFTHREPPASETPATPRKWSSTWSNLRSMFRGAPKSKKPRMPYCGHALHPRARPALFCPVCQVEHCFELLTLISEKWTSLGAPFRDPEHVDIPRDYRVWKHAWLGARLELIQLVDRLENEALVQEKLDQLAPSTKVKGNVANMRTAKMALEYARENFKFSLADPSAPEDGEKKGDECIGEGQARKRRKVARFREDVQEPSGRRKKEYRSEICNFEPEEYDWESGEGEAAHGANDVQIEDDTSASEAAGPGDARNATASETDTLEEMQEDERRDSGVGNIKTPGQ